ncbi:hypothetical protein [Methanobacterium sp. ACI-7]|uniref:hypothetical protein n=1 Tax=unclassified Methanobacterium TaxID=2627676 RepID=UPI0039C4592B
MNEHLLKLHEERTAVENGIYDRIKMISEIVNSYSREGDTIEIISNHIYKFEVTNGDIVIIKETGPVPFKDLKLSTDYQVIKLILERQEEILSKFIEFNERMIRMGKEISKKYSK